MKTFHVTIITNKNCNFNCTYCYEKDKFENLDLDDEKINKIINILKKYFNINFTKFHFTFIGGEPTLSKNLNKLIMEIEKNFKNSEYTIITNGSSFQNIMNLFPNFEDMKDRVHFQLSYDGKVINDKDRIILKNNESLPTSDIVLRTLDKLIKVTKNITLKPTLNIKYLPLVPEAIKEYRELSLKYNHIFNYGVTEVKTPIHFMKQDEIKELIKNSFPKILKEEKINVDTFGFPLSQWLQKINFEKAGAFCTAGIESITISTNLDILYCHRCEYYDNTSELNYGSLKRDNEELTIKKYLDNREILSKVKDNYYNSCENCEAIYCQKCPAEFAEINNIKKIDNIYNAWDDNICFYYKEISKYLYLFWKKYLNKK